MLKEFKKFILRGNLIDLSIGFTVGAAFSTVAKSLVNDIIMPPISALLGESNFENLFVILRKGDPVGPYSTLSDAADAGAVTLNYGAFINNLLALLLVALAMFAIIKGVNTLEDQLEVVGGKKEKKDKPTNKKCPYCYSTIDYRAKRCPQCTSEQPKEKK